MIMVDYSSAAVALLACYIQVVSALAANVTFADLVLDDVVIRRLMKSLNLALKSRI